MEGNYELGDPPVISDEEAGGYALGDPPVDVPTDNSGSGNNEPTNEGGNNGNNNGNNNNGGSNPTPTNSDGNNEPTNNGGNNSNGNSSTNNEPTNSADEPDSKKGPGTKHIVSFPGKKGKIPMVSLCWVKATPDKDQKYVYDRELRIPENTEYENDPEKTYTFTQTFQVDRKPIFTVRWLDDDEKTAKKRGDKDYIFTGTSKTMCSTDNKWKKILIIVGCVLALIGVGYGLYYYFAKRNSKSDDPEIDENSNEINDEDTTNETA